MPEHLSAAPPTTPGSCHCPAPSLSAPVSAAPRHPGSCPLHLRGGQGGQGTARWARPPSCIQQTMGPTWQQLLDRVGFGAVGCPDVFGEEFGHLPATKQSESPSLGASPFPEPPPQGHSHGGITGALQQLGQLHALGCSGLQVGGVLVEGVLHRAALPQVPAGTQVCWGAQIGLSPPPQ